MQIKGQIKSVGVDFATKETIITFSTKERPETLQNSFVSLQGKELSIEADIYREKRSRNANAYFHVLVSKIADKLTMQGGAVTKTEIKNDMITSYGQPMILDDEVTYIKTQIPPEAMRKQESIHCKPAGVKVENGKELNFYKVYRPSHEYDTFEMAVLIAGTVQDAKELGIETLTPNELKQMLERWGNDTRR